MHLQLLRALQLATAAAALAGVSTLTSVTRAQSNAPPEQFTAFAINMASDVPGRATDRVEITVDRWSTDSERSRLVQILQTEGPDALLRELQKIRALGRIRTPDTLGYDLRYAHQMPAEDGGRQIVIATDRPIGFWEARNRPRSFYYPFTVVEIHMGAEGVGEGKLSLATKITAGANVIVLENYATQPVLLKDVRVQPRK